MTSAHDPLQEPLRLIRESSLPTGFEERLAERLVAAQQRGNVVRFPSRTRVLLLVAAIALPAAAAAGGYYAQRRSAATSSDSSSMRVDAKPLSHLPKSGFTVTVPRTELATPTIEKLPAPRSLEPSRPSKSAPKAEERRNSGPEPKPTVSPPAAKTAPRIEALDPFAAKSTTAKQSAATPKGADVSESLRRATEQGTARTSDDSVRGSRRDANANANENRGNDAAQQARERVQARERKGQ